MSSDKSQSLRKSQFVFTYGPGALIETTNGPRLIPSLNNGLRDYWKPEILEKLEIKDKRLPKFLSQMFNPDNKDDFDYRIFSFPTNASLGKRDNEIIYQTQIFPEWHICYNSKEHADKGYDEKPILHHGTECPVCKKSIRKNHGTVRFIRACPAGHLDDIDWVNEVHHSKNGCQNKYFYWDAKGSSLKSITITCPKCGKETNMQEVYKSHPKCTGRYPEKEYPVKSTDSFNHSSYLTIPNRKGCKSEMRVMQRQSASLRVAETITLLSLPESTSTIENVLLINKVRYRIETLLEEDISESKFIERVNNWEVKDKSPFWSEIIEYIKKNGWGAFIKLTNRLYSNMDENKTFLDLINEEFDALLNPASLNGESDDIFLDDFILEAGRKENYTSLHLLPLFTLYPIRRIRTVTVQTNYRRMVSIKYKNSDEEIKQTSVPISSFSVNDGRKTRWFPGFEGYGEGLFLHFDTASFEKLKHGKAYNNWLRYKPDDSVYTENWKDICSLPEFVWLHTISHALIRSISEKTGYSAASIRERVYYVPEKMEGGILLYNTTPGSDGGLGGLIDIADIFEDILIQAEEYISICSNDPLCHRSDEVKQDGTKVNGSACYSCMLIAETSCEHGNRWLDRDLLLEGENGR